MKKFTNQFVICAILLTGLVFIASSCKKDKTPDRDKFLGAYSVVETCGSGNDTYDLTILESGTSENAIIVANLYGSGTQLSATVSGSNVTIASQVALGITWSGSGSISGNTLTISFMVSAGGASDNCTALCTRK
ncbi:MAG: hypothetical protein ACKVT2_08390 [Saprospiraceae bacterium]